MTEINFRYHKLTSIELRGLQAAWNLCDAHTHQSPSPGELENIVQKLPELFLRAGKIEQRIADHEVHQAFHEICRQQPPTRPGGSLLCYSSSQALEILANVFRKRAITHIGLYEPTFDSIPDILNRHGAKLISLHLAANWMKQIETLVSTGSIQVVFVVVPNNPTGEILTENELKHLSRLTAEHGLTLVIDSSFRLMDPRACFDFYSVLENSGSSYVVIEDSGKIWPSLDQKVAFLNSSADFAESLHSIHQDQLLNVSPFTNLMVAQFCRESLHDGLVSVRGLIQHNRQLVAQKIYSANLAQPRNADSRVSVEFLDLRPGYSATEVANFMRDTYDLWVLPGDRFYWSGAALSDSSIRLALSRDTSYFEEALTIFGDGLSRFYDIHGVLK